jgi:O-antigen/teichoic acid export membrane protein
MSTIRRQSIISSFVIYSGFAVGLLNTYFFTKEGLFTAEEYGLTTIFIAIATLMMAFATLAMPSYIFKFFHYYNDHLPPRKNDMLTWSLLMGLIGFALVVVAGIVFKSLVIRKFGEHSPQLITYYYWIFPLGFGYTLYTILEAYAWNLGKSVFTNFLREVQWRLFITLLIILFMAGIIGSYDLFIKLFSLTYAGIALILLLYLVFTKKIYFTFRISKVTRRFLSKIVALCLYFYSATVIMTLSYVFDTIVIASVLPDGAAKAGIFTLAFLCTSIIQAPQRGIIAASISHISKAWKEKDMATIQRIYQRSSINQLIFAAGMYLLIALNYRDAIPAFGLKQIYLDGFMVYLILGLTKIVDMGTGLNGQIISTSTYWRFELISGIILVSIMLPLTYILAKKFDIIGPAIASLISISLYNTIRILFLRKKFRLFPFSGQTIYTLLLAVGCGALCYFAFKNLEGFPGMIVRSAVFVVLYAGGAYYLNLSPDIKPVWQTLKKRMGMQKK